MDPPPKRPSLQTEKKGRKRVLSPPSRIGWKKEVEPVKSLIKERGLEKKQGRSLILSEDNGQKESRNNGEGGKKGEVARARRKFHEITGV